MGLPGCPTAELSWCVCAQGWATRSCTLAAAVADIARHPATHPARVMQHNQDPASQSFLGPHTGLVRCGDLSEYWPSMQSLVGEEAIVQGRKPCKPVSCAEPGMQRLHTLCITTNERAKVECGTSQTRLAPDSAATWASAYANVPWVLGTGRLFATSCTDSYRCTRPGEAHEGASAGNEVESG